MLDLFIQYFSSESDMITFSLEKAILLREDSYFNWKQGFEVKNKLNNVFITNTQLFVCQIETVKQFLNSKHFKNSKDLIGKIQKYQIVLAKKYFVENIIQLFYT